MGQVDHPRGCAVDDSTAPGGTGAWLSHARAFTTQRPSLSLVDCRHCRRRGPVAQHAAGAGPRNHRWRNRSVLGDTQSQFGRGHRRCRGGDRRFRARPHRGSTRHDKAACLGNPSALRRHRRPHRVLGRHLDGPRHAPHRRCAGCVESRAEHRTLERRVPPRAYVGGPGTRLPHNVQQPQGVVPEGLLNSNSTRSHATLSRRDRLLVSVARPACEPTVGRMGGLHGLWAATAPFY